MNRKKIILVGMPASGKSTLGKVLAKHFQCAFIDLDEEIEKLAGKTVPQIFEEEGEEAFRMLEAEALAVCLGRPDIFVLATGGGTPCFFNNLALIQDRGVSVYLEVPFEEMANRLLALEDNNRPLLKGMSPQSFPAELKKKFEYRIPFYKGANLHFLNNSKANVQDLIEKIQVQLAE